MTEWYGGSSDPANVDDIYAQLKTMGFDEAAEVMQDARSQCEVLDYQRMRLLSEASYNEAALSGMRVAALYFAISPIAFIGITVISMTVP